MLAMQPTKRLQRHYTSGAGSSEEVQKPCVVRGPYLTMTPLKTRGTDSENGQGAMGVGDELPVLNQEPSRYWRNAVTKPFE